MATLFFRGSAGQRALVGMAPWGERGGGQSNSLSYLHMSSIVSVKPGWPPDVMNWRAAKLAYRETISQYESLSELGPTERSRPEFTSFLLDVEKLTQKTLTPAELTLFHRRRKNLAAKERDAFESIEIKLGRAFNNHELWPADGYFQEDGERRVDIGLIQRTVAASCGLSVLDLTGNSHEARIVEARHVAIYLSRLLTGSSLRVIGRAFYKDPTSIRTAIRSVESSRCKQVNVQGVFQQIMACIKRVCSTFPTGQNG